MEPIERQPQQWGLERWRQGFDQDWQKAGMRRCSYETALDWAINQWLPYPNDRLRLIDKETGKVVAYLGDDEPPCPHCGSVPPRCS